MKPQAVIVETSDGRKLRFSPCLMSVKPNGNLELYKPFEGKNHFIAVIQAGDYRLAYCARNTKDLTIMSNKPLETEAAVIAKLTRLTTNGKLTWLPDAYRGLKVYKTTFNAYTLLIFHQQIPSFLALYDAESDSVIYRYMTDNIQGLINAAEGGILDKVKDFTRQLNEA